MIVCMCGRFATLEIGQQKMADLIMSQLISEVDRREFERKFQEQRLATSYSVAPTNRVLTAFNTEVPEFVSPHWGFQRPWARGPLINATAEKLNEARTWKKPFRTRRCLVSVSGYYEWVNRKPFYITRDEPLLGCGLWEERGEGGKSAQFFTMITTPGLDSAGEVHDRMPLFLAENLVEDWLNPAELDEGEAGELLETVKDSAGEISREIEVWEVSTRINSVRTASRDDATLIEPVTQPGSELF